MEIGVLVIREPTQPRSIAINDEEIGQSAVESREHELLAVGRPARRLQSAQLHPDAAILLAALHIENHEVVALVVLRRDGEEAPIRRERSRRIDEAQAL